MAGWSEVLAEIQQSAAGKIPPVPDFDGVRTRYMHRLHDLTGRSVIVYASGWLQGASDSPAFAVQAGDVHALMETCRGMPDGGLDLILHTPGGSLEAAEQMLNYLRSQFDFDPGDRPASGEVRRHDPRAWLRRDRDGSPLGARTH
ncbi:hypothetical protein [Miltoncostaea oceani]|uniref:hypothetical protein n=1 Tax=Miltoncostaea oceani TaxID=2843216 RepID=UPI001C3CAD35|nr:hypothetical protein [Miltoncostaea oceani]